MHHDLPAEGIRLLQPASGYVGTWIAGVRTRDRDRDTRARPVADLVRAGAAGTVRMLASARNPGGGGAHGPRFVSVRRLILPSRRVASTADLRC